MNRTLSSACGWLTQRSRISIGFLLDLLDNIATGDTRIEKYRCKTWHAMPVSGHFSMYFQAMRQKMIDTFRVAKIYHFARKINENCLKEGCKIFLTWDQTNLELSDLFWVILTSWAPFRSKKRIKTHPYLFVLQEPDRLLPGDIGTVPDGLGLQNPLQGTEENRIK